MLLLDTCTLLWFLHNSPQLPDAVAKKIEENRDVHLSVASLWEIAIKKTLHKISIPETIRDLEQKRIEKRIRILHIRTNYMERIQTLPYIHGDLFDRMIIATAIEENLLLLTDDDRIKQYKEVKQFW